MWRHFPHHSHAICGEISDFYTSVTRRNLKLLHMWRKFRFLHICHVERFEITLHVEKFQKSPHLSCIEIWNFSTWQFFSPQIYWWDWWQIWGMFLAPNIRSVMRLSSLRSKDWGLRTRDWRLKTEDWGPRTGEWRLRIEDWRLRTED